MTSLRIIHFSDLHFAAVPRPVLTPTRALKRATEAILRDFPEEELVLVISGDVTTQGSAEGYVEALAALNEMKKQLRIAKIVVCPGNHDIAQVAPKEFREFNRFAFDLTNDPKQTWNDEQPVAVSTLGTYAFVLTNTSFHGDHSFGRVPLGSLKRAMAQVSDRHLIVVVHHSPISSQYGGGGMADAYELLAAVSNEGATALLHGHVHSDQGLRIGNHGTLLSGAGSLGFQPDGNMNNQFAIHEFTDGTFARSITYRYYRNWDRFEGSENG